MKFDAIASSEIKSTHSPSRRISSNEVGFHRRRRFYPPTRVDLVEKPTSRNLSVFLVEHRGLEPLTPTLPVWCAPNCANAPCRKQGYCNTRREKKQCFFEKVFAFFPKEGKGAFDGGEKAEGATFFQGNFEGKNHRNPGRIYCVGRVFFFPQIRVGKQCRKR